MESLEELLLECCRRGLRVNNLFQIENGAWQANFRVDLPDDSGLFFEFGHGPTPTEAIRMAMLKVYQGGERVLPQKVYSFVEEQVKPHDLNLQDLGL